MAVVRVEFDIDGDVYPELYATLAVLRHPMLRDERVRQLAAMGLAWEAVRMHGSLVTPLPGWASTSAVPEPAAPVTRTASRAVAKSPARKAASRPGSSGPGQLPVLVDIVATNPDEASPSGPPPADDGPAPPVDPVPVSAASRGPGARTRLMRMKDRGLFKNG